MNRLMLIAVTMLACLPAAAGAGVIYQYDDGTEDNHGGAGTSAYLAWMVKFSTVQPGGDKINAVEISLHEIGSFEAVVWRDSGGNGYPADARVLSRTPFTVTTENIGWITIPITPVTVSGYFFVGAYNYGTIAPIDYDTEGYAPHRSWFSASASALDLNDLAGASLAGWFEDLGLPYVAMVRAQATPEPATMALLAAGGIAALLRRRRK
ncbi:MAG: PEP-CTERM sorting domain-containing protein [Planctomycetota bacterium]|nr:PEP-CTERM sorting domain-containing protein [Planctomycetota bacterium]